MDQSNGALLQGGEFTLYSWSTKEVKKKNQELSREQFTHYLEKEHRKIHIKLTVLR